MAKSLSPLIITINRSKKRIFNSGKECTFSGRNLYKKIGKISDRKNLDFISPHSRARAATKRRTVTQRKTKRFSISKIINQSSLNRVLRTNNPSYFTVLDRNIGNFSINYIKSGLLGLIVRPCIEKSKFRLEKAVIKSFLNKGYKGVPSLFRILRIIIIIIIIINPVILPK